jgi:hypothetical protein
MNTNGVPVVVNKTPASTANPIQRPLAMDIIKLKAVGENREIHFRVKTTSKLGKLKKSYCKRVVSVSF